MISISTQSASSLFTLNVSGSGPAVYLDNWAISDLARHDPDRRSRFFNAMRLGRMDLLFSLANVADVSGFLGNSASLARGFLDEFGPCWIPAEMNSTEVVLRELRGEPSPACVSEDFIRSYNKHLWRASSERSPQHLLEISAYALKLGAILDWVAPQRGSIRQELRSWDESFKTKFARLVQNRKKNRDWFEKKFSLTGFNPTHRARRTYVGLLRSMVLEGMQWKPGDCLDFHHAVIDTAFSAFAALDTHWKRRASAIPNSSQFARIYSATDLDQMVLDMECWAYQHGSHSRPDDI
jgi:hypothetical protein